MELGAAALIHEGPKSIIRSGPRPGLVTKIYLADDLRTSREAAEVEFARGRQVHAALADVDFVSTARPVEIIRLPEGWALVLERVRGHSLIALVDASVRPQPEVVGTLLGSGIVAYCTALGEAYYGLKPQDVLYDPEIGDVSMLDFEPARSQEWTHDVAEGAPVAASLGLLLGRSLHYLMAPSRARNREGRRWLLAVIGCAAAEAARSAPYQPAELDALCTVTGRAYRRMGSGTWFRRAASGWWQEQVKGSGLPLRAWRPFWYGALWLAVARPEMRRLLARFV